MIPMTRENRLSLQQSWKAYLEIMQKGYDALDLLLSQETAMHLVT